MSNVRYPANFEVTRLLGKRIRVKIGPHDGYGVVTNVEGTDVNGVPGVVATIQMEESDG